jgi:hypothetical protein
MKYEITLRDNKEQVEKNVSTDGYLLLYLDDDNRLKIEGAFDVKVLMPYIAKFLMEKFTK